MRRKYIEEEIEALKNNIEFVENAGFLISEQKTKIKSVLKEALNIFKNNNDKLLVENVYENLPYIYSLIHRQNVNRSKRCKSLKKLNLKERK